MSRKPKADSADQMALDLEDARERVARMRRAVLRRDAARDKVRRCESDLRLARGEQKQAEYDLSLIMHAESRAAREAAGGAE